MKRTYLTLAIIATLGSAPYLYQTLVLPQISQTLTRLDYDKLEATASGTQTTTIASTPVAMIDLAKVAIGGPLDALKSVKEGAIFDVRHGETAPTRFRINARHESGETIEIRGYALDDHDKSFVIGLRPDGITGFFELSDGQIHALSYAEGKHYAGKANDKWMADKIVPEVIVARKTSKHDEPPVQGAMPVYVKLPALAELEPGDTTTMQLPGIGATRVAMDRLDVNPTSSTWVGHLADFGDNYPVLITYSEESIEGSALTPHGEVILSRNYAYNPQLLGLEEARNKGENCALGLEANQIYHGQADSQDATTQSILAESLNANPATGNTVDVLVYYSPDMEMVYGSEAGVATRIDALFAATNQAYMAGNLGYALRRVGLKKIITSETTSNNDTLARLQQGRDEFANVAAEREALGADMVSLIRPLRVSEHVSCGVAYVGGYNIGNISNYSNYMTSVVGDGTDRNGQGYYCTTTTFAHETGHNLGLMHDRTTVAQQGGGVGVKPFAYGYSTGSWGTIMSYKTPVMYRFSNPDDNTCNSNESCGVVSTATNSADNVQALAFTLPLVSAFKPAKDVSTDTTKYTVSGIISLNGVAASGVVLSPSSPAVTCGNSGTTGMYTCQAPKGSTFTITPNLLPASGYSIAWTPPSASFSALSANATANFSAKTTLIKYTLSGKITKGGVALANTSMKVTGTGATCGATNSLGIYSCSVLQGSTITLVPNVVPATGTTITWTPASLSFSNVSASNTTAHFSGVVNTIPKYTISGKVTRNGVALANTSMKVTGTGATCGTTSSLGIYSCSVLQGSTITLVPNVVPATGTTITWTPASLSFSNVSASNTTANFSGITGRKITGSVKVNVNGILKPVAGASLNASNPGVSCDATSSTGAFSCSAPNQAFTLQPIFLKPGYTFTFPITNVPSTGSPSISYTGSVTCPSTGCVI